MVSICFKSQNKKTIIKLEQYLEATNFNNLIYSSRKFSKFYNFIIHFCGNDNSSFYKFISNLFCTFIKENYEEKFIRTQLQSDFFYFSNQEQTEILGNTKELLNTTDISSEKNSILQSIILSYITTNRNCIVEGFINFRIYKYRNLINKILEEKVHEFVIQKEYLEYINLLQDYISTKSTRTQLVHLIYSSDNKILVDEYSNVITTTSEKKYLSDISFSENDFILNSILSLMPKKLLIHCNEKEDNFIQFLSTIFGDKCSICTSCKFCSNFLKKQKKVP
ncbi:MAG: putative sporulation protein YtxC [Clostridia bacterium]|nr:putative sporulation protein YtxC [Clostridia bacterium]